MGVAQSRRDREWNDEPSEDPLNLIRIESDEIPDEYRTVNVSQNVIDHVNQAQSLSADAKLSFELSNQIAENKRLRQQVVEMQDQVCQQIKNGSKDPNRKTLSFDEETVMERKRIFDETVFRLEKKFFTSLRINECVEEENAILRCLVENPSRVLNCKHLSPPYKNCINKYREKVIRDNLNSPSI